MSRRLVLRRTTAALLIVATPLALYAFAGYVLVPYFAQRQLPGYVQERLGHELRIGDVTFDPFLLRLVAHDAILTTRKQPLLSVDRLVIDLAWASLWHDEWELQRVQIVGLEARLERGEQGHFNFLPGPRRDQDQNADQRLPPLRIERLGLDGGRLTFVDRSGAYPVQITLWPVVLEAKDVSTRAGSPADYNAEIGLPGDGAVRLSGRATPVNRIATGRWQVLGFRPIVAWPFLGEGWDLAAPEGRINATGSFRVDLAASPPALVVDDIEAHLTGLLLARNDRVEPPLIALRTVRLRDGRFDLGARALDVRQLELDQGRFRWASDREGRSNWSSLAPQDPSEPEAAWHVDLQTLQVSDVGMEYVDAEVRPAIHASGELDAAGRLRLDGEAEGTRVRLEDLAGALRDVALSPLAAGTSSRLRLLGVDEGRFDSGARRIAARTITARGGGLRVVRRSDGRVALGGFPLGGRPSGAAAAASVEKQGGAPWRYAIGRVSLSDFDLAFVDRGFGAALSYRAKLSGRLMHIESGARAPIRVDAEASLGGQGRVRLRGQLAQDATRADARVVLSAFALPPLQPLLARYAALDLVSGEVGADLVLRYAASARPQWRADGRLEVQTLRLEEQATGDRLLSAQTVSARGTLSIAPNRVSIAEVDVVEPGAKLEISRQRKFNLVQVLQRRSAEIASPPRDTPKKRPQAPPWEARIERVRLRGGVVDFADYSLVLPFSASIEDISASAVSIATAPEAIGVIEAEGRIEPFGLARLSGRLKPAQPTDFTDLRAEFENVAIPPLSPYTATFAGRKVSSGDLWLDLHYRFEDGRVLGSNEVTLENFTLGERVKAPNALDIPVELAVALLKDEQGRINLAVPVEGTLDDPQFDYGRVIGAAVKNVLTSLVTAPFRFLARLVGRERPEDLAEVAFAPGSDRLTPPEQEDLLDVVEALKKRPQLQLVVQGAYDPRRDAAALRADAASRMLAEALGRKLGPDEPPGPFDFTDRRTQLALESLAQQSERIAGYTGPSGGRAEPGRSGGRGDAYRALFERLAGSLWLPPGALEDLAAKRAGAIVEFFVERVGIPGDRVATRGTREVRATGEVVPAELELQARDVAGQPR